MATTVIKKKHVIILWIQNLHHINAIFELQDHVVVRPVSLSICSILEFNYKWWALKWLLIARLQRGYTTAIGWKLVIDDFDQQELCLRHEAFTFQLKCRYVSSALRYAVKDMPLKTWLSCCSEAIDSIYRMDGVIHVKNKETVYCWHLAFRCNNEALPNPHIIGTKTSNPALKQCIVEYAKQNLNDLSAKIIYSYLHKVALPAL
jgi:hypothetical protein